MCERHFVFIILRRARTRYPGRTRARARRRWRHGRRRYRPGRAHTSSTHPPRRPTPVLHWTRLLVLHRVYLSRTIPLRHQCDYRLHTQRSCRVVGTVVILFSLSHTRARRVASFPVVSVAERHTDRRSLFNTIFFFPPNKTVFIPSSRP